MVFDSSTNTVPNSTYCDMLSISPDGAYALPLIAIFAMDLFAALFSIMRVAVYSIFNSGENSTSSSKLSSGFSEFGMSVESNVIAPFSSCSSINSMLLMSIVLEPILLIRIVSFLLSPTLITPKSIISCGLSAYFLNI